jgi:hypothetical protein
MANGWNPLIGIGFTALGVGYLYEAFHKQSPATPVGRLNGAMGKTEGMRPHLPYATLGQLQSRDGRPGAKSGIRSMAMHPAGSIDNRLKFIVNQIRKDSLDPQVITEARMIVSQKCETLDGGKRWCIPVKGWKQEIAAIFNAVTNPNSPFAIRYTRDHATVDMFASSALMRRLGSEDCDGMTIRVGALLRAIGYSVRCRIVAPAGSPGAWAHIYLMVGTPPGDNKEWVALDPTEAQYGPFWEVPNRLISSKKDYEV